MAISGDFKLHVFNEHLNKIATLPLKVRLINFAYFYEENNTTSNEVKPKTSYGAHEEEKKSGKLITAGIDGCYMFEFVIKCKYDPKQAVLLDPDGNTMTFTLGEK